jgi:membrane associated rhomboid family serine protease
MHGKVEVDLCRNCGGLWFEEGELKKVLRQSDPTKAVRNVFAHSSEKSGKESDRGCADCNSLMKRFRVKKTGVEAEQCDACGGIWLESGMLEKLAVIGQAEQVRVDLEQDPTIGDWLLQFFAGLPREFNCRPKKFPILTVSLIALNSLVFLFSIFHPSLPFDDFLSSYGLIPVDFPETRWGLTLFGSQFLHGGFFHLLGNMYFLYLFGDNIEDVLGRIGFLLLYVLGGALAGAAETFSSMGSEIPVVGASGAVAAIGGAYIVIFRKAQLTAMFIWLQFKIPAIWAIGLWFAFNSFALFVDFPGVAWAAHIAGLIIGVGVGSLAYRGVMTANPILQYLNDAKHLHSRFHPRLRGKRKDGGS